MDFRTQIESIGTCPWSALFLGSGATSARPRFLTLYSAFIALYSPTP